MNQARIGLLVMAALIAAPSFAHAQRRKKPAPKPAATAPAAPAADSAASGGGDAAGAAAAPAGAAAGGPVELDADAPPPDAAGGAAPGGAAAPGEAGGEPGAAGGDAGGLSDICQIDPSQCPSISLADAAKKELKEQMYAVQQIYALRAHRFELQPVWTITMNDQFVDHPGPALALNYYISNVLAIGISGGWYTNNDKEFNAQTRRAARVAVPLTEYLWHAALNFTYVPMYGKFAGFGDFIFHYDAYVVGGVGAIVTRPYSVVDPDNRAFPWDKPKVEFNAGLGLRIFFNRWFAAVLEVRDYIFFDKLERTADLQPGMDPSNSANWYGDNKITNNVQAQVGVSVFLPFSWEYRLPK